MTLDDAEKLARDYRFACAETGNTGCIADDLARALLAVLPVVRSAEAWHRVNTGMHTNGPQHTLAMRDTRNGLVDAIDTMHAALEKP